MGWFLHNSGKEDYVWNVGDPLGQLLVLPWSYEVNGKLQQLNPGRMTKGPDSWEWKYESLLQEKNQDLRPSEVPAGDRRNTEWVGEESSYEYHLRPRDRKKF